MEGLSKMERLFKLAKVSKLPWLHLAHLLYTIFGIFHFAQVLNFYIPSFLKEIILKNLWKFVSTRGWSTLYNERTPRGALYCVKLGFVSTVNVHGPPSLSTWPDRGGAWANDGAGGQVAFEPSLELKCKVEVTFNTRFSSYEQKRRIVKYSNIL